MVSIRAQPEPVGKIGIAVMIPLSLIVTCLVREKPNISAEPNPPTGGQP
jgi:hypothetical protein